LNGYGLIGELSGTDPARLPGRAIVPPPLQRPAGDHI
jgi:hypothetical protein